MSPKVKNLKIGLTGSIGMGKSTVAKMFSDLGAQLWDADAVVKRLYFEDVEVHAVVRELAPKAWVNGAVDFPALRIAVRENVEILTELEAILHPKTRIDRDKFLLGEGVKLCDIPLLFENNMESIFDHIIVVSAAADIQRMRVLARSTMTPKQFDMILARQVPDKEKRARADFIVRTGSTIKETGQQVADIWRDIHA